MRWNEIFNESATCGSTSAGNIASVAQPFRSDANKGSVGFDDDYSKSIYPPPVWLIRREQKPSVLKT